MRNGQDLYEVSHIVKETQHSKSGPVSYHVRWAGWEPEHDSVFSEEELVDAPDALDAWKRLKGEIQYAIAARTIERR